MSAPLRLESASVPPAAMSPAAMSPAGASALRAVRRGLLARAAERRFVRLETIPAMWPMTRHLVRRMGEQLVNERLLERGPNDVVRITAAGRLELDRERSR